MSADTKSLGRGPRNATPASNPIFRQLPDQYYNYALQWSVYPRWTVEEAANLLTGCVPHRQMLLRGEAHQKLDAAVLENENRIRAALGKSLKRLENKKYFSKTYVDSQELIEWALSQPIAVPTDLIKAHREAHHQREIHGYRTPALEAVDWVVNNFWEQADMRAPPNPGEIIQALLQAFPNLDARECEMIEHITRHPAARIDLDD